MIYIVWLTLLAMFVFSFIFNKVPLWIPIVCYLLVVIFRVKEKVGNYNDWLEINKRDEKLKLGEVASDMANGGLTFSSIRNDAEKKVAEDFQYERKKQKRKFENEIINSLFLK